MNLADTFRRLWNARPTDRNRSPRWRRWAAVGLALSGLGLGVAASPVASEAAEPASPPTATGQPLRPVASQEPQVADRDAMRVRVVNRPHHGRGAYPAIPWDAVESPGSSRPLPESPPLQSKDESFRVPQYDVTISERTIGRNILQSAASDDLDSAVESGRTPPNFARELIPNAPTINVNKASRYREDFVVPVDLTAAEFCYRPLYFEEVNLERYGTSHGLWQPILSGARFFATVPAMPYLATVKRPCVARYWPHHYPAGRRAPFWEPEGPPFDLEAAGVEGLAVYGLILLIP